jgi:ElaB/YqjD/DUF883 family membrane-anchored ribosome-binding protein
MSATTSTRLKDAPQDPGAAIGEVKTDLLQLKEDVMAAVRSAIAAARDGVYSGGEKVTEAYDAARERGAEAVENVEKSVSRHPLTSIAIAAGVGMLVGLFMRRH